MAYGTKGKSARQERISSILFGASTRRLQYAAWQRHLASRMSFPFTARYGPHPGVKPFCDGAMLHVIGLAKPAQRSEGVLAKVMDGQRSVLVPLELLAPRNADSGTSEAVADWRYWRSKNS